jgi:hypothetical protein
MAIYLIHLESAAVIDNDYPEGLEPPNGYEAIAGEAAPLNEVMYDPETRQIVPRPLENSDDDFVVVGEAFTDSLRRAEFLEGLIGASSYAHLTRVAIANGGAIANELSSLKSMVNSSPQILFDSLYSSVLRRCLGRVRTLLAGVGADWTESHLKELNGLLQDTLGVDWRV